MGVGADDAFKLALIDDGRIPIVTTATLRMQSDAIRNTAMVSSPGPGNDGKPTDPGPPPKGEPLPTCGYSDPSCTVPPPSEGGPGGPKEPPPCGDGITLIETAAADVLFDFDKATLNDAGKKTLDDLIAESNTRDFESLALTGYTDPLGSVAHNDKLSLDRANAVRDYLTGHGFPAKPITTEGRGSKDLIKTLADCPSEPSQIACLAPDRRVVFTFEKVK
jgi:outer membrane protein OmpA-like peptidoglycan-associated protein